MKTICILCPVGCELTVQQTNDIITVSGNECPRGLAFGKAEFISPLRMLTTLIKTPQGIASVKLTEPIPKQLVLEVKDKLKTLQCKTVRVGDVVASNICGTTANVVVTHIEPI